MTSAPASFISRYLSYATNNEAPEQFHIWCAYSALSTAIGRRVWLPHGSKHIFPNVYVLLIGDAGCGKNYAIEFAVKLMEKVMPPGMVSYDVETPEGLLIHLAGDAAVKLKKPSECCVPRLWPDGTRKDTHQITIVATEFVDFIRQNQEAWTGLLCNIYDKNNTYAYRTKGSGTNFVLGPYVGILGGMPTDISKDLQKANIITSGFARRCVMQYGERQWNNPHAIPTWTEANELQQEWCVNRLLELQKLEGEMSMTPEAVEFWKEWYDNHTRNVPKVALPSTKGWLSSKPMQVLKFGMLSALSERGDLKIIPGDFILALSFLDEMEKNLHMIFGGIGRNELAAVAIKVMEYMNQCELVVSIDSLRRRFFHMLTANKGFAELDEIMDHLVGTGQLVKGYGTFGAGGLAVLVWATPSTWERERASGRVRPDGVVQTDLPPGSAPSTGPSTGQAASPAGPSQADQTGPVASDETGDASPQTGEKGPN